MIASQSRVLISGQPVLLGIDTGTVSGCARSIAEGPPCLIVSWVNPAKRVRVNGAPVLLSVSTGIAQGTLFVAATQSRVLAN